MKNPPQFQGVSVQHLVLGTISMVRSRWIPVAISAVTFALVMAAASTFVNARMQTIEDDIVLRAGVTQEALIEQVSAWATETSDVELLRFAADYRARGLNFASIPTKENAVMLYVLRTGPYVFLLLAFNLFILFLGWVYFLVFFSDPLLSPADAVLRLPKTTLRIIGLLVWMMVRSFSWIPFVGLFVACYFYPRFVLAPSLVASGDSGIIDSIRISMARTSGKWWSVVGRLLVLALLTAALLWFVVVIASVITLFFLKLGFLIWLVGLLAVIAFQAAYVVVLGAILA